ncbi:hypothetical protein HOA55_01325 [archaeon]|jgi:hypothetical protein|nr:hypothetical protein [archaeon]MBT3578053.1 hypothetical protein [archaeon]MBT6819974.1 hypothetical protein [archaeon]MBT6956644.1 hypothetical protein [archaeon]MBT7025011.1 hypothetical protein [archaeon]
MIKDERPHEIPLDARVCYNCEYKSYFSGIRLDCHNDESGVDVIPSIRHTCGAFEYDIVSQEFLENQNAEPRD